MALSKKRRLTPEQAKEATAMINAKMSLGKVARHFGVNKPAILKSIGIWKTSIKDLPDGRKYQMVRGRMDIYPKSGKKPKGQGFQIR